MNHIFAYIFKHFIVDTASVDIFRIIGSEIYHMGLVGHFFSGAGWSHDQPAPVGGQPAPWNPWVDQPTPG